MGMFDGKKAGGMIGYHGLTDFWQGLSDAERHSITSYARRFGMSAESLTKGNIVSSTDTPWRFLSSYAGCATAEKNYSLAEKMYYYAMEYKQPDDDRHFLYNGAIELYYKQRDTRSDALDLAKEYCHKDINLFTSYGPLLKSKFGVLPRCPSFQQLAIIYEKEGKYDDAIKVCELAIKYRLSDGTKGDFAGRIEKLKKKSGK